MLSTSSESLTPRQGEDAALEEVPVALHCLAPKPHAALCGKAEPVVSWYELRRKLSSNKIAAFETPQAVKHSWSNFRRQCSISYSVSEPLTQI